MQSEELTKSMERQQQKEQKKNENENIQDSNAIGQKQIVQECIEDNKNNHQQKQPQINPNQQNADNEEKVESDDQQQQQNNSDSDNDERGSGSNDGSQSQQSEENEDSESDDNNQSKSESQQIWEQEQWEHQITINQDTVNQILTVHLRPGQAVYHNGEVIISNRSNTHKQEHPLDIHKIMQAFHLKHKSTTKIQNIEKTIAYYCIRRKGGGGKILHLPSCTYGQNFIIDYNQLLTINCPPENYTIHPCYGTSKLYKLKFKANAELNPQEHPSHLNTLTKQAKNLVITLQAEPGSIIVEKYLGNNEKFYIKLNNILAISQNMDLRKQGAEGACIHGPGYVFMVSNTASANYDQSKNRQFYFLIFITIIYYLVVWFNLL